MVSRAVGWLAFSEGNAVDEFDGPVELKIDARLLLLVAVVAVPSEARVVTALDRLGFFSTPGLDLRRDVGFRAWSSPVAPVTCGTFPLDPFLILKVFSRFRCSLTALSLCSSSIRPP